jgi:hypothetical protein
VIWKFLGETGREVGEKMRGELGRRPIVLIAFLQARLCMAHQSLWLYVTTFHRCSSIVFM